MTEAVWDRVRTFALGLPQAIEDFPWETPVIKIDHPPGQLIGGGLVFGPMFLWLGKPDASLPAVSVKLRASYEEAVSVADATPMTYSGLGQWGWLTVPLDRGVDLRLLCDWVEESYRIVAPKKLIAELDESG
ncbi:MmcQ/YjbR family DNA-binding protein [Microlunatus sp. GCM10028923]|uniref:MmcQ/YjbR family DNA-binding protein n=1 Tax=Microlunatus sp. GCM10028923 TaxID=3273400 RepID=UPI00360F5288